MVELGSPATRASQARRTCKTGDGARWLAGRAPEVHCDEDGGATRENGGG